MLANNRVPATANDMVDNSDADEDQYSRRYLADMLADKRMICSCLV